ncbi:unnamed protein product [Arctia plantaginis]|uniref:Uncharacterized protein n=1 Tax=Arctia plantaginis TaxID=874455 RepID=A0A8S1AAJ0_ARCPL|nr:unnamed protein product [Arctia plantaginis]
MRSCKKHKPLQVHRMQPTDVLSSRPLENIITNRKKSLSGEKVSGLQTKEILLKNRMFSLFMRYNIDDSFVEVDLKKNCRGRQRFISKSLMQMLWPDLKMIPQAKLNDIKSLMHLIPRDAQAFHKKLTGDNSIEDDVDGISGEPDFEIEVEVDRDPIS